MTEYLAPTKRRPMTKARAAKIWLREQGRCYLCSRKLRIGVDLYQIEHPDPLCLGGSDNDDDLRVVCIPCHKGKSATDAAAKAKRDRIVTAGWAGRAKPKWGSRGFPKREPQHTATRPIERRNTFKREEVK